MPLTARVVISGTASVGYPAWNMPAQRRCAASLYGRHHLELIQPDMTGMCGSPSRSVTTEDVGDLEVGVHWPVTDLE